MVYNIIQDIKNEPSSNGKIDILRKHKDNALLKNVFFYAYNPLINYYTKHQVPIINDYGMEPIRFIKLDSILTSLDNLINREIRGKASVDYLNDLSSQMTKPDRIVLNMIINRDVECGLGAKSINKVWPKLIPVVPYERCSSMSEIGRIKYPAIIQRKANGIFCNGIVQGGKVKFLTRNGSEFSLDKIKHITERFAKFIDHDFVITGELVVVDENGLELPRKTGNGLINSLIKKDSTIESLKEKANCTKTLRSAAKLQHEIESKLLEFDNTDVALKYVIWDIVNYDDWVNGEMDLGYSFRLSNLEAGMKGLGDMDCFRIVETKEVNTIEEAQEFYKEQIEQGHEGAVLKNKNGIWKNYTSPDQVKMKAEKDCDLRVVGYEPGTGKYSGGIGSLVCESSDGKLVVSIGYGLSDADRGFTRKDRNDSSKGLVLLDGFDPNQYNGTIITVKYNEVITSKSKDTYSLFLAGAEELNRLDKDEADSLDKILKG